MAEAVAVHHPLHHSRSPAWTQRATSFGVFGILAVGAVYAVTALVADLTAMPTTTTLLPFVLLGVALSSGLVAFTIVSLLPVELILQVGSAAGFAMVFALLIAAIIWNIGTWYFGIPNSSSHALIGSIIGVGLMNQIMGGPNGTSGVDWSQATGVLRSLAFSPLVGFVLSAPAPSRRQARAAIP